MTFPCAGALAASRDSPSGFTAIHKKGRKPRQNRDTKVLKLVHAGCLDTSTNSSHMMTEIINRTTFYKSKGCLLCTTARYYVLLLGIMYYC